MHIWPLKCVYIRNVLLQCHRVNRIVSCSNFQIHTLSVTPASRYIQQTSNKHTIKIKNWNFHRRFSNTVTPKLEIMKIDTPEFHALFTPELEVLTSLFDKYGYELRIAGGAVRDLLAGTQPHDLDFATTATPDEMKAMFNKEGIRMLNMKGETHGTITCRINDKENFEVTTLRIDVVTDGRHAEVQFTKDWELDALRRDLTINSMFLDLDGTVYDYFKGREHLEQRKIYFVGEAKARIQEDYLRILRYFRFYGRIAVEPDDHDQGTLEVIRDNMHGLSGISGERIWVEMKKILTGNHAASLLKTMMSLGLSKYLGLPEKMDVSQFDVVHTRCQHLQPHHMTLMSSVLTDEAQVYALHTRVKMSREELRTTLFIIKHRADYPEAHKLQFCQDLTCDTMGTEPKTKDKITELIKYCGDGETLEKYSSWTIPKFPISGHIVLARGVKKGPGLAKMLNALRQIWKKSSYAMTEEELMDHVERLKNTI